MPLLLGHRMGGKMMKDKALISTIQFYSTKDGPGIRTTVFFVGCNLKCKWCSNPELIEPKVKDMYFKERDTQTYPDEAYERVGYEITVGELFERLMRDKVFYDTSGGGVTFSGGEAALQSEFVIKISRRLREAGVHVALDTAGDIPSYKMKELAESVDMVLYDIKAYDGEIHNRCTGVDNKRILENAQLISDMDKDMIIRMIIVPGYNDALEDVYKRVDFIEGLGKAVKRLDILRYHNLGAGKYERLGIEYTIPIDLACDEESIDLIYSYALNKGFHVNIEP
ncbi:pyruvate formate lyase activating enzyme [Alkalibaculum bacchi]|uniref:Pyruvate formate lyase activating enzyme n=2 Tax=Alkalibaculum bacchi TaxID=645887 RepID=A0A366I7F1_9FIRM|nr:pyruvate formate lyase activating enzyme [Alkalibaculum bacchi]